MVDSDAPYQHDYQVDNDDNIVVLLTIRTTK